MVRWDFMRKSLGFRIFILLFWTAFVCCLFYVSKVNFRTPRSQSDPDDVLLHTDTQKRTRRLKRFTSIPDPVFVVPSRNHAQGRDQNQGRDQSQGHCYIKSGPISEDLVGISKVLERNRKLKDGSVKVDTIHCSVVSSCRDTSDNVTTSATMKRFKADCRSSTAAHCGFLRLRFKHGHASSGYPNIHSNEPLTFRQLSEVVDVMLEKNSFMSLKDLNDYIEVYCGSVSSSSTSKLSLDGDIAALDCKDMKLRTEKSGKRKKRNSVSSGAGSIVDSASAPKVNVHILLVRFLSHWELPVRVPGLFSWLEEESSNRNRRLNVLNFDKHQATTWNDDDTLSMLLQGKVEQGHETAKKSNTAFNIEHSLLGHVKDSGHCFRLAYISCSNSKDLQTLVANVTTLASKFKVACQGQDLHQHEETMERVCSEGNTTETEFRSIMTSLLSSAHEPERFVTTTKNDDEKKKVTEQNRQKKERREEDISRRPVVSVSVLNSKDFKSSQVLDNVLRNFFTRLLHSHDTGEKAEEDTLVLLLGDVGNPTFLRFDQSVRFQSQGSNPAAVLVTIQAKKMKEEERELYGHGGMRGRNLDLAAIQLNGSLFCMEDVHSFVKTVIGGREKQHKLEMFSDAGLGTAESASDKDGQPADDSFTHNTTENPVLQDDVKLTENTENPEKNCKYTFDIPVLAEKIKISGDTEKHGAKSVCSGLAVQPPFTCLCEDGFVAYENDTLMAGYAELAVSLVNARLQQSPSLPESLKKLSLSCAALRGVSFSDVFVGQAGQKRRVLLRLLLEDELTRDRMTRHVALDIWDMDKAPRSELHFFEDVDLSNTNLLSKDSHFDRSEDQVNSKTGETLNHENIDPNNNTKIDSAQADTPASQKYPRSLFRTSSSVSSISSVPLSVLRFEGESSRVDARLLKTLCRTGESLDFPSLSYPSSTHEAALLKKWSVNKHFGQKASSLELHDKCLFLMVRDFGDSVSVEAANLCTDRSYFVQLHLSLMNMVSLSPLPLSASVGHSLRAFVAAIVKLSYTTTTFAYKLHPDYEVIYDDVEK